MDRIVIFLLALSFLGSCSPKEPVVLRQVHIRNVSTGADGNPVLKADAVLYNPNKGSLRLKEIELDILLDDAQAARIDQQLSAQIKAESEFTVPLEVQLKLKDSGLLDTILSLFGGKKHVVRFTGKLRVKVGLFSVSIPVDYRDEIRL